MSVYGRYLLFVRFKKPISIPAIQSCNIFYKITVATRPTSDIQLRFPAGCFTCVCRLSILGDHLEPSTLPKISLAPGSPLWDACDAAQVEVFDAGPDWAIEQQISRDVQFNQSVNW